MTQGSNIKASTCLELVKHAKSWLLPRLGNNLPWERLTKLPQRLDGTNYTGTNILVLWMQQDALSSHSPVWGSLGRLQRTGYTVDVDQLQDPHFAVLFQYIEKPAVQGSSAPTGSLSDQFLAGGQVKRIRIAKLVELFNLAQTSGFDNSPADAADITGTDGLAHSYQRFFLQYLDGWKKRKENENHLLTVEEEAFVQRFSTDIVLIGRHQVPANQIVGAYPEEAIHAVNVASNGRLMKLAGVSQEILDAYLHLGLRSRSPAPTKLGPKPVAKPSNPIQAPVSPQSAKARAFIDW